MASESLAIRVYGQSLSTERSNWEPAYFRNVMLMHVGEGIRQRLRVSEDPIPDELVKLLRRLDIESHDETPESPPSPTTRRS
jgi:hypothetical protein